MEVIETTLNNMEIKGVFTFRDKWGIVVEITHPYVNFSSGLNIPGIARQNPNPDSHYLSDYGITQGKYLLKDMYKKLVVIEREWEIIVAISKKRDIEVTEVEKFIIDKELRTRIVSKLNDWFYNTIFRSYNISLNISDQKILEKALSYYYRNGKFLFDAGSSLCNRLSLNSFR
jgi:hypothetical protein